MRSFGRYWNSRFLRMYNEKNGVFYEYFYEFHTSLRIQKKTIRKTLILHRRKTKSLIEQRVH